MYETRIESMCALHMEAIRSAFGEFRPRKLPHTFFADASLLRGKPLRILTPDLYRWHFDTSKINEHYLRKKSIRVIKRLVPLPSHRQIPEAIDFIKYSLHFQMALGTEVWVVFTDDPGFLDANVESENISVVRGHSVAISKTLYELDAEPEVSTTNRLSRVGEMYDAFRTLGKRYDVIPLWYDSNSFSSRRVSGIKKRFGDFLYALQSGTCAISGDPLLPGTWHVDHIYPLDAGGNNSLINLQAVRGKPNLEKGASIQKPRFAPTPEQLREYGFDYEYYRNLSDRARVVPRLGWHALHHLNLFAL